MRKKTKNKGILIQSAVFILLIFSVGIIINAVFTYRNFYKLSISDFKISSDMVSIYAQEIFQKYSALSWLLDYWEENYKKLNTSLKSYNQEKDDIEKYNEFSREFLLNRTNITSEQAAALAPEEQKLLAEFCYNEIAYDLNALRRATTAHSFVLMKLLPGKGGFVYFYIDKNSKETRLGDIFPVNIAQRPLVKKMYATGKNPKEFEIIQIKDYAHQQRTEEFFYHYSLVKEKNEVLCHLVIRGLGTRIRNAIFNEVLKIVGVNICTFVFLGFIVVLSIYFYILKPLLKIQKNVKDYTINKDYALAISKLRRINSQNETGRLADDLSSLITALEHYTNEAVSLSAEKAKIDSELSLAAKIQDSALSKDFPDVKEFKLFASMNPAREVGGDLYDFFMIDEDHIVLIIGDVSGKGISAALFMMKVKTVVNDTAISGKYSPVEILERVNKILCEGNEAMMFVTLWLGILTISTGEIISTNAGHEYPFIKDSGGSFKINKSKHSRPLGLKFNAKFLEEKFTLKPGDVFFIYTDGVAEANNKDGKEFGLERLTNALNECPDDDPKALTEFLLQKINGFTGTTPQFDDITTLCIKYFG